MKTLAGATDNDGRWWMTATTTRTREQLHQWLGNYYYCWKMVVAVAWGVSTKEWWLGDGICEIEASSSSSCWWMLARGWWHWWSEESSNICQMTLAYGSITNVCSKTRNDVQGGQCLNSCKNAVGWRHCKKEH